MFDLWLSDCVLPVQVIGDWDSVINTFVRLNMRPEILFFENVSYLLCFCFLIMCVCVFTQPSTYLEFQDMQRKRIVNAQINTPSDVKNTFIQKWDQLQNFMFSLQPQSSWLVWCSHWIKVLFSKGTAYFGLLLRIQCVVNGRFVYFSLCEIVISSIKFSLCDIRH